MIILHTSIHTRFSLSVNSQADAGRDGGRPSRETKFSGANGDKGKNIFPSLADHEQDWQPCLRVDWYSAISDEHTYIHILKYFNNIIIIIISGCQERGTHNN